MTHGFVCNDTWMCCIAFPCFFYLCTLPPHYRNLSSHPHPDNNPPLHTHTHHPHTTPHLQAGYVRNVADIVSVGAKISVRVISIETEKNKFGLSLLTPEQEAAAAEGAAKRASGEGAPRRASRNSANFTRGKREGQDDRPEPTRGKVATRGMCMRMWWWWWWW